MLFYLSQYSGTIGYSFEFMVPEFICLVLSLIAVHFIKEPERIIFSNMKKEQVAIKKKFSCVQNTIKFLTYNCVIFSIVVISYIICDQVRNVEGTMIGRTYILNGIKGTEQLTFLSKEKAFIGYKESDTGIKYRLSDGSLVDMKKDFKDISYTDSQFFGTIDWAKGKNRTYVGAKTWEYSIEFSSDFKSIKN